MMKIRGNGFSGVIFSFMSVAMLVLILLNSESAIDYMSRGMKLCTTTVIPSLFPFMVVSEIIVRSGAASLAGRTLSPLTRRLFGIGGEGSTAFLLGAVCGFPIGTRVAAGLYRDGRIEKDELSRLIAFSNNPSSAFVISAVGVSLFGCKKLGVALYFITLLSAVSVGVILNLFSSKNKEYIHQKKPTFKVGIGAKDFTDSISSSALGMLNVSAFVIFFSVLVGTLSDMLSVLGVTQSASALIISFFELTMGVASASIIRPVGDAILVAAFALGFSGLSVHFQVTSLCDGLGISMRGYFLSKLLQGLLGVLYTHIYLRIFGSRLEFNFESVGAFERLSLSKLSSVILIAFFASVFVLLTKRKRELLQRAKAP